MIPFGQWNPDQAGINTKVCRTASNVVPAAIGFAPMFGPVAGTDALPAACMGAAVLLRSSGATAAVAGTMEGLFKLATDGTWTDVTRTVGGPYATPFGEMWRYAQWGDQVIATNYIDDPQVFDFGSSTEFDALAGTPPKARYIDVVRDQVVLAGLYGYESRLHWSGTNDATWWTVGSNNCDYQDFPSGGPIKGFLGGATGWVFQHSAITRMTQTPGAATIYQFDPVQGAKGLQAPHSLVRVGETMGQGDTAYYLASDGFHLMDLATGAVRPIGHQKWRKWFLSDMRPGSWLSVIGAADPLNPLILWCYISVNNNTQTPDRMVVYDRVLDEATTADISVEALATWITSGVTLDTMDAFGSMETLPYSLDSPYWRGGTSIVGLFGTDHKLAHLLGGTLAATIETSDGMMDARELVSGIVPFVDSADATVALSCRERDADAVTYDDPAGIEDTGEAPCWNSGNLARARIQVPADSSWTYLKGLKTVTKRRGKR